MDPSDAMLEIGRSLPNGDHPNIHWICSTIEDAPLGPRYGLAVAGASIHWFAVDRVLPRLADVLEPGVLLVLLEGDDAWEPPWDEAEMELMIEFVTRMEGKPPNWETRSLEEKRLLDHPAYAFGGQHVTAPAPFEQTIEDYVACQHSRATFAPEAMGPVLAREFDAALTEILTPHARDGVLRYDRRTLIEWGVPQKGR